MTTTTKNGIYLDVTQSPYMYCVSNLTFYFTSKKHLHKFINLIDSQIEKVNQSLSHRFHCKVTADDLAALQLYTRIEPNVFHIRFIDGTYINNRNDIYFELVSDI